MATKLKSYKSAVILWRDGDKGVVFWALNAGFIALPAFSISTVFSFLWFLKGKTIIQLLLLWTPLTTSFLSKILCLLIVVSPLFVTCDCLVVLVDDESCLSPWYNWLIQFFKGLHLSGGFLIWSQLGSYVQCLSRGGVGCRWRKPQCDLHLNSHVVFAVPPKQQVV